MVGSVERIEQDIAALEHLTVTIAQEFHNTYNSYLTALGQAVRQHLISASYHLCTQGYPERFLKLSLRQRQQLQQAIQQLAQQAQAQLIAQLKLRGATVSSSDLQAVLTTPEDSETCDEVNPVPSVEDSGESAMFDHQSNSPGQLTHWQENLERGVVETLQNLSHAANRILQQSHILQAQLSEPVLEVAAKSEDVSEITGPPSLLNLLVETETEEKEGSEVVHIIAIHLRLSEVEFNDSTVTAWRTKIRNLSAQLNKLRREHHKKQRERAIAEAQAAWRSSWSKEE